MTRTSSPNDYSVGASPSATACSSSTEPSVPLSPPSGFRPTCAKFTSGPWQRRDDYDGYFTIIGNVDGESFSDGTTTYTYDFIANCEDEYGDCTSCANQLLIIAAPELYAALEHIRELLTAYGPQYIGKAIKLADAALAKARGEQ